MSVKSAIYLMTHSTNPLISEKTLSEAINKFKTIVCENEYDSLFFLLQKRRNDFIEVTRLQ